MDGEITADCRQRRGRFNPSWELNHPPICDKVEKSILRLLSCMELHCRCLHDCAQVATHLRDWYRWYHAQNKAANCNVHPYLVKGVEIADEDDGYPD